MGLQQKHQLLYDQNDTKQNKAQSEGIIQINQTKETSLKKNRMPDVSGNGSQGLFTLNNLINGLALSR